MNRQDRKRILLLLGIVSAWALMLFFCINSFYYDKMDEIKALEQQQAAEITAVQDFYSQSGTVKECAAKLNAQAKLAEDKLPEAMGEDAFAAALNEAARGCGTEVLSVSVAEGTSPEEKPDEGGQAGLHIRTVKISLQGSFFELVRFMRSLNAMQRFAAVKNSSIKAVSDENNSVRCDLTLQIYSYNYNR